MIPKLKQTRTYHAGVFFEANSRETLTECAVVLEPRVSTP